MKNDDLQNLILSAVKRGYTIRFRKPINCEYLAVRVEKELPNGSIICRDRYTTFDDVDQINSSVICIMINAMIEEFKKMEEQNND